MNDPTDVCRWFQDGDEESDLWGTSCRKYFRLGEGTPEDNNFGFCCFCGKPLIGEPYKFEDEEE